MKKCAKCKEVKPLEEFHNNKKMKQGKTSYCKNCNNKSIKEYKRTLIGNAKAIYTHQKQSSKIRGHHPPAYAKQDFVDFLLSNKKYINLHSEWVESGYENSLIPSVDRIDDYKGYSLDNIEVMTWKENRIKSNEDRKNGINNMTNKAVVKMDLNEVELEVYHSLRYAERKTSIHQACIWRACNGEQKTAGGFKWKYAEHK
jgi:hypothetical protein